MKLLASDFDNTLFFDHKYIKENDLKAIQQFQQIGHLFGVCTGRSLNGVLRPSECYDIDYDFYILLSGALILNKDKDVIFEKTIPLSLAEDIFEYLNRQEASVVYQDQMYCVTKQKNNEFHAIYLNSFSELNTKHVSTLSFHYQKEEIALATKATHAINEKYGHLVEAFQNNEHIDLAMKGCSKGAGLKFIQDYYQIKDDDVYCIGDSWNDLPMLTAIQHAYTFTYAPDNVQQQAEVIVESLEECINNIIKTCK